MKKVFDEVGSLDKKCYEVYGLTEDILMEHASLGLYKAIPKDAKSVMIVAGVGNNGGDGIALARLLQGEKEVYLYLPMGVKSPMAKLQLKRAENVGVKIVKQVIKCDVIVDAIFGSGLKRELSHDIKELLKELNTQKAFKIACDIPTGIDENGCVKEVAFKADVTVTMGALKESLFLDEGKDFIGKIKVIDLGVSKKLYEDESDTYLLQKSDLKLPLRDKQNSNKGNFGHLGVVAGQKVGASVLCAEAGFAYGSGLVSIIENENYEIPPHIMSSCQIPQKSTAICIGMGLGNSYDDEYIKKFLFHDKPLLLDADMFYNPIIKKVLETKDELVLTPHPKEFSSLLKLCEIADVGVEEIQKRRFFYAREFSKKYPKAVLVLKGANVIITQGKKLFINPLGTNLLSKGGSGDVLAGLISSLLAQGYTPLDSAINGSLAHTLSAKKFRKNNYALTPENLIEGVKCL